MSLLEKIAPAWCANRSAARVRNMQAQMVLSILEERQSRKSTNMSYEAAGRGRRFQSWQLLTGSTSPGQATSGVLATLRQRSREMVENNAHAKTAVGVIESEIVGSGIRPQSNVKGGEGRDLEKMTQEIWERWGETTECDAQGRHNFYGIQALCAREMAEAGECLVRMRPRRTSDKLTIPIQLQVLEPDFLDTSKNEQQLPGGRRLIQGIEFDALGRRVAYHLFPTHPGDSSFGRTFQSKRVPASRVVHIFRTDRAGQVRGIPWGAAVLLRLKDWEDYQDAQLVRQKIAACFVGFERDQDAEGGVQVGTGPGTDASADPPIDSMEPGTIERLSAGKTIEFSKPPGVEGIGEYAGVTLREIAKGFDVTYEALTGDLRSVNFSSGRMGRLAFQRDIRKWRAHTIIPQLCEPVWRWFQDAALISGMLPKSTGVIWTPPPPEFLDPRVEVRALKEQVRAGFLTLDEAIRMLGFEPRSFLERFAANNKLLDELGLVFDSDPRADANGSGASGGGNSKLSGNESDLTELVEELIGALGGLN